MALSDMAILAQWIEHGRQGGSFRSGEKITEESVGTFQKSMVEGSDSYECLFVSIREGARVGFLDYRIRGQVGELLGLYLEPQFRNRRFGRYLLRWTLAVLREQGCHSFETEVYADNVASLRACEAAGFSRVRSRDREEDGRAVYLMSQPILPLEYLSPENRFRYPPPKSGTCFHQDFYFQHLALAEALTQRLKNVKGVQAVLGLGSIAHRFADSWSDLDIAIIGRGAELRQFQSGEHRFAGLTLDLFVVDLETSPAERWENDRRQAFGESIILYSAEAELIESIREVVRLTESERGRRIGSLLLELGWVGFQPRSWFGSTRHGYTWEIPYDLWIRRGSIEAAHSTVHYALDLLLQLMFLANDRHVPDAKWRRYLVSGLDRLPEDFETLLPRIEVCSMSYESFESRAQALLDLVDRLVAGLESQGSIPEDLYTIFLQSVDY